MSKKEDTKINASEWANVVDEKLGIIYRLNNLLWQQPVSRLYEIELMVEDELSS